jgi:hypothetical protein
MAVVVDACSPVSFSESISFIVIRLPVSDLSVPSLRTTL